MVAAYTMISSSFQLQNNQSSGQLKYYSYQGQNQKGIGGGGNALDAMAGQFRVDAMKQAGTGPTINIAPTISKSNYSDSANIIFGSGSKNKGGTKTIEELKAI